MLKVTVAEVQRDVIKQLGIDLNGSAGHRHRGAQLQHQQSVPGATARPLITPHGRSPARSGRVERDDARDGARRRDPHAGRAEPHRDLRRDAPTSWPAANSRSRAATPATRRPAICQLGIEFKKFGVGLNFTPVVLSEGRISLKVHDRGLRALDRERAHAHAGRRLDRPFPRSRRAAPKPRWKFPPAARWPWPA